MLTAPLEAVVLAEERLHGCERFAISPMRIVLSKTQEMMSSWRG